LLPKLLQPNIKNITSLRFYEIVYLTDCRGRFYFGLMAIFAAYIK